MKLLILYLSLLGIVYGQIVSIGKCPEVETAKNFNMEKYQKLWYEVYRYEHLNQTDGDCVIAEYKINEEGNLHVRNTMVLNKDFLDINGELAFEKETDDGDAKLIFTLEENSAKGNYWVLDVDYDTYALVYDCVEQQSGNKKVSSWILSRFTSLPPLSVLKLDAVITASGLHWDNYRLTSQSGDSCEYERKIEKSKIKH